MTKEEELVNLKAMRDFFNGMTDDEFFDYLYKQSPSFKIDFDNGCANIKEVFLSGMDASMPKWHKVADGDLPKEYSNVLAFTEYEGHRSTRICNYHYGKWWVTNECAYETSEVIAWCEIPQYTEE